MLIYSTISVFAQTDDPYAKFQGIWYGVIDNEYKVVFIFIDDVLICNLDYGFSCKYLVENHELILINGRFLGLDGWDNEQNGNRIDKIQFLFSGEKLILAFDGEPIIFSRNYEDFPEWW
jgi:hypothetical protein